MTITESTGTARWEPEPDQRLYSVPEIARILGVSEAKGWQLVARGVIRSLKIDASRRITPQALADYIAEREQAERADSARANEDAIARDARRTAQKRAGEAARRRAERQGERGRGAA
jgi:Helix-turn-helix domain